MSIKSSVREILNLPITLKFHTCSRYVFDFFKPREPQYYVPYFKTVKKNNNISLLNVKMSMPTINSCPSFLKQKNLGLVLPFSSDLLIEIASDGSWKWNSARNDFFQGKDQVSSHYDHQYKYEPFLQYKNIKIMNDWFVTCDEPIDFYFGQVFFNKINDDFHIVSGITNFFHQHETHVNFLFKIKENNYTTFFNAGTPLVQIFPLSKRKIKVETFFHDNSSNLNRFVTPSIFFEKNYRKIVNLNNIKNES